MLLSLLKNTIIIALTKRMEAEISGRKVPPILYSLCKKTKSYLTILSKEGTSSSKDVKYMEDVQDYTISDQQDAQSKLIQNRSGENTSSSKKKCLKLIPPASLLMQYSKILGMLPDSLICWLRTLRLGRDSELISYSLSGLKLSFRRGNSKKQTQESTKES